MNLMSFDNQDIWEDYLEETEETPHSLGEYIQYDQAETISISPLDSTDI